MLNSSNVKFFSGAKGDVTKDIEYMDVQETSSSEDYRRKSNNMATSSNCLELVSLQIISVHASAIALTACSRVVFLDYL